VEWNEDIHNKEFIDMNKKDKNGRYMSRDHEMAKHFNPQSPEFRHSGEKVQYGHKDH
jgi:hypothetical protein